MMPRKSPPAASAPELPAEQDQQGIHFQAPQQHGKRQHQFCRGRQGCKVARSPYDRSEARSYTAEAGKDTGHRRFDFDARKSNPYREQNKKANVCEEKRQHQGKHVVVNPMPVVKNRPGFLGMQRFYHAFFNTPGQDDKPGNLDAARRRPGTGTGKAWETPAIGQSPQIHSL